MMTLARLRHYSAAVFALACLTACNLEGRGEVPLLSAHFAKQLPSAKRELVAAVRVCQMRTSWLEGGWFATVFFLDDRQSLYHYRLNVPVSKDDGQLPVALEYANDEAQRGASGSPASKQGCYGARREEIAYQVQFKDRVVSYVTEYFQAPKSFDSRALAHLQRTVQAVEHAAAHLNSRQRSPQP